MESVHNTFRRNGVTGGLLGCSYLQPVVAPLHAPVVPVKADVEHLREEAEPHDEEDLDEEHHLLADGRAALPSSSSSFGPLLAAVDLSASSDVESPLRLRRQLRPLARQVQGGAPGDVVVVSSDRRRRSRRREQILVDSRRWGGGSGLCCCDGGRRRRRRNPGGIRRPEMRQPHGHGGLKREKGEVDGHLVTG